jgi:hypothetical protein|tara:strand:+ start:24 stop:668 length:645 start_codon:yes stop_codon:yes gene_type:complete
MALSKVDFNNINVTPAASKALKWNSSANGFETGDLGGNMVLLSTTTASSSATIDITSGIDSTYKEYIIKCIDIHPATNDTALTFQTDTGTNTSYNQTMTTTRFKAGQNEAGNYTVLGYETGSDQAQGTSFQVLTQNVGNGNDESLAGTLHIFEPSNTTFVKHFLATFNTYQHGDATYNDFTAGYFNTTTAITRVRFKMASGNIDAGTFKLYGIL